MLNANEKLKTDPYVSSGLKRDTTFTVTCTSDGISNSDYVKVSVSPISAGYTEH